MLVKGARTCSDGILRPCKLFIRASCLTLGQIRQASINLYSSLMKYCCLFPAKYLFRAYLLLHLKLLKARNTYLGHLPWKKSLPEDIISYMTIYSSMVLVKFPAIITAYTATRTCNNVFQRSPLDRLWSLTLLKKVFEDFYLILCLKLCDSKTISIHYGQPLQEELSAAP